MATLTPRELAIRERIEALIRVMEPCLDLVLAFGDRVSRLVERDEDWEPPPPGPGLTGRAGPGAGGPPPSP
jgi:hypothetical protein